MLRPSSSCKRHDPSGRRVSPVMAVPTLGAHIFTTKTVRTLVTRTPEEKLAVVQEEQRQLGEKEAELLVISDQRDQPLFSSNLSKTASAMISRQP